jgi:NAD(P)-dependent dehydrogenase (short-subunit alcohol dehydrogenase family)
MSLLARRVALVTGAGRGNGAAIARGLAQAGAIVAVTDVDAEAAAAVAGSIAKDHGTSRGYGLDVTVAAEVVAVVAAVTHDLGPPAILINNAGILLRGPFTADGYSETFERTLAVNLAGAMRLTHACLPALSETRGAIVNIASIQSFASLRNSVAYTTSKAALAQFTKATAVELAPRGIRVNALAPGIIETDMSAVTRSDTATLDRFLQRVPMGRVGLPDELIGPVVFLCSPMASYVTGAILAVDGGFLAQ